MEVARGDRSISLTTPKQRNVGKSKDACDPDTPPPTVFVMLGVFNMVAERWDSYPLSNLQKYPDDIEILCYNENKKNPP